MVHGPETKPSQNPLVKNVENNNSGEWNLIARCGIWYAGREGNDARVLRGDLSLANITWQLVWLVETGSRRRSRKRKSNKAQVLCHILTLVYQERDIYLDLWKTEFHFNSVLLLGFADWERKRNGRTKRNPNCSGALGDAPLLHCFFLFLSPRSCFRWRRRRGNYCCCCCCSCCCCVGSLIRECLCRLDLLRVIRRGFWRTVDCVRQGGLQR